VSAGHAGLDHTRLRRGDFWLLSVLREFGGRFRRKIRRSTAGPEYGFAEPGILCLAPLIATPGVSLWADTLSGPTMFLHRKSYRKIRPHRFRRELQKPFDKIAPYRA